MQAVIRFQNSNPEFGNQLADLAELMLQQAGCQEAEVLRNIDDNQLWILRLLWQDVGSYRRALSSYQVKLLGVPTLLLALDEPSAYLPASDF